MHLKSILTKNLDKFKSINRLRTATHLLGTCWNCTCCWFIFGIDFFVLAFLLHDAKLARKPHRTFGYQNYDWNLKTPKKTEHAQRRQKLWLRYVCLSRSPSPSLARSSSHSLSLYIFLIACFALSSVRLDFRFRFDFVFIWAPRRELNLNLVLSLVCLSGCLFEWKSSAAVVALSSACSLS